VCLKDLFYTEVRDHDHPNMYDSSEYITSNPRSLSYDSNNVPQDNNEDEN
jgi:hypothetical protein